MNKHSNFLNFALKIAKEAGKIQMSYFGNISSLEKKSTNIDLLTKADLESEKYIITNIQKEFPDHSILSEEAGSILTESEYLWIIDPLDGTTNFTHNLPIFAVSVALVIKNKSTICGVVYNPAADKCFYAEKNNGAFLNNNRIFPSKCNDLNNSLLCTGFPYLHDEKYNLSFEIFKKFYDKSRGIRRLGSASLDLCFVGMGRFDGYYEYGLKPWDISAGSLIASESGCNVTDWNGKPLPNDGSRILCTNGKIHKEMINLLTRKEYELFF